MQHYQVFRAAHAVSSTGIKGGAEYLTHSLGAHVIVKNERDSVLGRGSHCEVLQEYLAAAPRKVEIPARADVVTNGK